MTVRSSAWPRLKPLRWPRVRLWLDFSRTHVIALIVSLYVGILLLLYLHLAGQIVAVQSEIDNLQVRLEDLREENAWRAARVAKNLSVHSLAILADTQDTTAAVLPLATWERATVLPSASAEPTAEVERPTPFALWLDAFHLKGE